MMRRASDHVIAFAAALFALSPPLWAQFDEEVVEIRPFKLVDWGGKMFIESDYRQDSDTRPGSGTTKQTDTYLETGVEIEGRGYLYHPNLADWNARLRLGYTRQDFSSDGNDRSSQGRLLGYSFNAALLRTKLVGLRLFGTMTDQLINRSFTQALDYNFRTEGFEIQSRTPVEMSLLFEHTRIDEQSTNRAEIEETYFVRFSARDHRHEKRITELVYEHEDTDQQLTFSSPGSPPSTINLPLVRDDLTITNNWRFGPDDLPHTLVGTLRAQQQTGFLNSDFYFFTQQLTLQHGPTLSSFYTGRIVHTTTEDQSENSGYLEAGVRKDFYESLTLIGRVSGSIRDYDNGEESAYGGTFHADYRKKTPIGLYRSTLRIGRRYKDESFDGGTFRVLNEPIDLDGIDWMRLSQPNVIAGTVVVTDLAEVPYTEGVDYMLRTTGAFTEVRRIAGGNILDGDPVLVDYTVDRSENSNYHNDRLEWNHRIQLNDIPVAVYTRLRIDRDTLDGGMDPGNLEEEFRFLVGGELTLGQASVSAEYEWATFELSPPFTAYRGRAGYISTFGRNMTLNLTAHYEMIEYQGGDTFGIVDEADFQETMGAFANFTAKPRKDLLVGIEARVERAQGRDESLLARISPHVTWKRGLTEVNIRAYHEFYEQDQSEGTTDSIELKITRRF